MSLNEDFKVTGLIEITVCDKHGHVLQHGIHKNIITNAGFAALADLAGDVAGGTAAFDYIELGTGTTAATTADTTLETIISDSGLARAQDATPTRTTTTVTNDTLNIDYTWTASGSKDVTEAALLNAAAAGTMLARQTFGKYSLISGNTFKLTWKIKFS